MCHQNAENHWGMWCFMYRKITDTLSCLSDGYVRREEASIEEVDGVCVYVVAVGNTTWHKATATCVRVCVYVPSGIQW